MKDYDKTKESSYIQYLDANNLYGAAMSKKLPIKGFKWLDDIERIDEEFIKEYNEISDKGYVIKADVDYPICINCMIYIATCHSYLKGIKQRS